ncbi:hypothetical protein CROQUDRAFT_98985 [Cronartium quercuum f. sp. fusiforme G11]|uniref:Uncharacterized protein n=1 Tax=Cronartium quercuum f. sp. fusiforme G11 TaxID=708437 RepID=A0A9P6NCL0_9BASI|nr:hypothetical protein CROQUDRAFT_98985 [Cronartium quercuum f. sp. fusiforme G11]
MLSDESIASGLRMTVKTLGLGVKVKQRLRRAPFHQLTHRRLNRDSRLRPFHAGIDPSLTSAISKSTDHTPNFKTPVPKTSSQPENLYSPQERPSSSDKLAMKLSSPVKNVVYLVRQAITPVLSLSKMAFVGQKLDTLNSLLSPCSSLAYFPITPQLNLPDVVDDVLDSQSPVGTLGLGLVPQKLSQHNLSFLIVLNFC